MGNMLHQCLGFSKSEKQPSTQIEELCHRFSLSQLRKATNNFDKSRIIGGGNFGTVYKGATLVNGEFKDVAIKRSYAKSIHKALSNEFKNEIVLLCQLRHHNLVSLIGFCYDENEMILVYEYLSNGSLFDHLHRVDNYEHRPPLSWKKRLEICIGIARGLHYLHTGAKHTIFHCDVKPTNILLDENWVPKVADLGLSIKGPNFTSRHPKPITNVDIFAGTYGYMAPEYISRKEVTDKVDIYSIGAVLVEIVCRKAQIFMREQMNEDLDDDIFDDDNYESEFFILDRNLATQVRKIVQRGNADKIIDPFLKGSIASKCWELFLNIAERCLVQDPIKRPTMGEVEMELERALQLQEEADALLNSDCEYNTI